MWSFDEAKQIFELPFFELVCRAHQTLCSSFEAGKIQLSTLLSIKTGGCSENCAYCSQSARYKTGIKAVPMLKIDEVLEKAKKAKERGASRFCMGASGRGPRDREFEQVLEMIREVKKLGLETCVTLGMIDFEMAKELKNAGLDYYNHNLDTSEEFYPKVITTRTFQDRLDTLEAVRRADLKICCGGILGLGETNDDRLKLLVFLANMPTPPESVPINKLVPIPGTPLERAAPVDPFDFIRIVAVARILMPRSWIRLSAGRESMSDELQAWAFFAGSNSIFSGERLLTAPNAKEDLDERLFSRLNLSCSV